MFLMTEDKTIEEAEAELTKKLMVDVTSMVLMQFRTYLRAEKDKEITLDEIEGFMETLR